MERFLIALSLCTWAFANGYYKGFAKPFQCSKTFSSSHLLYMAWFTTLISMVGMYHIWGRREEFYEILWTAEMAMWSFFHGFWVYALGFCIIGLFFHHNKKFIFPLIFQLVIIVDGVMQMRRAMIFTASFIAVFLLFFRYKIKVRRLILVVGGSLFFIISSFLVDVRGTIINREFSLEYKIAAAKEKVDWSTPGGWVDTLNGIVLCEAVSKKWYYNLGIPRLWNYYVHFFVPGFVVGNEVKKGLKFPLLSDWELCLEVPGFWLSIGSCMNGIGEAFSALGYFGCIFFYFLGYWGGRLFSAALKKDNELLLFLYFIIAPAYCRWMGEGLWVKISTISGQLAILCFLFIWTLKSAKGNEQLVEVGQG